jgi:hypothetical protein
LLQKRPLTLTPDLLVQFDKIGIKVPATALDIPPTIEAIKAQQVWSQNSACIMARLKQKILFGENLKLKIIF